jgi:hypothetical protein
MTEPGLNNRLRQHARRAGLMVGISMALTIAICIGSFAWIYAQVDPFTRDFVDAATAQPTAEPESARSSDEPEEAPAPTAEPEEPEPEEAAEAEADPTEEPEDAEPTATSTRFRASHRIRLDAVQAINLRPGPAVASGEPIGTLPPGTEIQFLNEEQASQDPNADGDTAWLKFRTVDGQEGWIRQIDVEPINPGQ